MNLQKLFETQAELDALILTKQNLEEVNLKNMILAVITEIGEMSNEWGGFKDWKVNKQPKEGLLDEIADVLSFILVIGNQLHHRGPLIIYPEGDSERNGLVYDDITSQILSLTSYFIRLWEYDEIDEGYRDVLTTFAILTEKLGFTWDEVEQAYFAKNRINHERQESGY
ncbi:dUTP diphosphatase [Solibacillus sp. A46]|uniref:dUTP diphosphatase n=1 Tax=Solibacillus faecavium TaxID=2762221 RepID=A0ABR8XYU2_9BACL|nr:dUTP diphosphatase [Solibacillus faecavium]MBD8037112.1 dUTP diphosphatase [Solibacillus faecavium]